MLGMASGIEDDEPLRRVEDDSVAVGTGVEWNRAGNEVVRLCGS